MNRVKPEWKHHRIIHSKYPPLDCFESEDALVLGELESATSDRVAHWPRYVDKKDFRYGPGWGADSLQTGLREWGYHAGKVWRGFGVTNDCSAVVRCYKGHTAEPLVDLRSQSQYMHNTDYAPGQQTAADLLNAGEYGILYSSVRHPGAEAIALLRPPATTPVIQAGHYVVQWDGHRFTQYARIEQYSPL